MSDLAIYVDGGCLANPGRIAFAAVAVSPVGQVIAESAQADGEGTNNEAEYKALLYGICLARLLGAKEPHFVSDSMLVVQQVLGFWAIKGHLHILHGRCTGRLMEFERWSISHVPRERNRRADWLVNRTLRGDEHARTLKNAPDAGTEFLAAAELRPGWAVVRG